MHVDCYGDASAFEKLRPEWNDLLHKSHSDTLFLTWEWQSTWWKYLGADRLCIIAVREDDGKLVGIAPLFWVPSSDGQLPGTNGRAGALALIGCVEVSDYLDFIIARGYEQAVYGALLDALMAPGLPAWTHVHLCNLPGASPTNSAFKEMAQARGLRTEWRLNDVCPRIDLPARWDEYLDRLDKKQRHEIRRKLRRAEEAKASVQVVGRTDPIEQAMTAFVELHRKSQPEKRLFMDESMKRFFVEIARVGQAQGWLQLEFLELDGERVATLLNFVYADEVLVYNSGYDPARHAALGPGFVLQARSIQAAIEARRRAYDFLQGAEEYKYRFGAENKNVYELCLWKDS